jgi:hypothetical protein
LPSLRLWPAPEREASREREFAWPACRSNPGRRTPPPARTNRRRPLVKATTIPARRVGTDRYLCLRSVPTDGWRRRTNQYPAPVLDLQAVRAFTPVFPPAPRALWAPLGTFPRRRSSRSSSLCKSKTFPHRSRVPASSWRPSDLRLIRSHAIQGGSDRSARPSLGTASTLKQALPRHLRWSVSTWRCPACAETG